MRPTYKSAMGSAVGEYAAGSGNGDIGEFAVASRLKRHLHRGQDRSPTTGGSDRTWRTLLSRLLYSFFLVRISI